jgi:hypothetical protein
VGSFLVEMSQVFFGIRSHGTKTPLEYKAHEPPFCLFWHTQMRPCCFVGFGIKRSANDQKEHVLVLIRPRGTGMEFSKIAFVDFVEEFLWRNGGIGIIITRPSFCVSQRRGNRSERQTKHTQQQSVRGVFVYL